jgi:regulator of sigma E protease
LLPGDIFVSLDGEPVNTYFDLQVLTAARTHGAEVVIVVERAGERLTYRLVPEMKKRKHPVTGKETLVPTMGIDGSATAGIEPLRVSMPVHRAVSVGAVKTWDLISGTMIYISDMVFKDADRSQLGGPIRIAKLSGDAARSGFSGFFWMIAVLSTSIGLINLFPIPILDGGHLMFYAVEWLRGRPVGEAWMRIGTMVGLSLVLLLMVFATYNDLVWLF